MCLVDGDDTYDARSAPELVQHLICNNLDMVNGARAEAALRALTGRVIAWVIVC